ncbi:hypothetical protein CLOLEP_02040 [[Clostridium] leptum DSM 753]|uniref:Uncharacterized protein n=1 Tax=[Clostridium] leptum DSM 753 TaxID=428125 RepID=A7VTZ5_9FIRM|nr:hypothetical protein CLOLEP_02040 [[Clostridium] leptum DSM 753]
MVIIRRKGILYTKRKDFRKPEGHYYFCPNARDGFR